MSPRFTSLVVDQLAQPLGERPRLRDDRQVGLGLGPLHHALVVLPLLVLRAGPLLVGEEQLDLGRVRNVLVRSFADDEVREVLEQRVAERVRRVEDRRPRAEVAAEGQHLGRRRLLGLSLLRPEHLEVGVAEPVDGLVLVTDREEARLRATQLFDEVELDPVRVLELVHHQVLEAPVPLFADSGRGAK